ncbi:CGNR zinc finger domain-containing protein [Puerhibacterium sp. TATVAM-FAB25]|uniref:CGNR zinc finger domain-containing protein n=1 Tax=Puerhibacterium sp. TATVAM-FAB25 TaxID=3093699 RepID=UPI00397C1056
MIGVRLAEDLVNLQATGPWEAGAVTEALRRTPIRFDRLDDATLGDLHAWARRLRGVFAADDVEQRAQRINALLAHGVQLVQLATHDGLPPHLHFAGQESSLVQRVRAMTAGGIAIFAVEAEAGRMGVCARPGCLRVFADTSKNGRRAYCSATCGNSHAVQRYRERQAYRASRSAPHS